MDHRADIYSLGCILFEMVCGRRPFLNDNAGDLLAAHIMSPPPLPRGLTPALPITLERLILRMLAKNEADRPQSMEAVAAELDAIVAAAGVVTEYSTMPSLKVIPNRADWTSRTFAISTVRGSVGELSTKLARPASRRSRPLLAATVVMIVSAAVTVVVAYRNESADTDRVMEPPAHPAGNTSHGRGGPVGTGGPGARGAGVGEGNGERGERDDPVDALAALLGGNRKLGAANAIPRRVVHDLECDPECEVVVDGVVVGKAASGSPYRVELPALEGQWRDYVLRPVGARYCERSLRAPVDRSVIEVIRLSARDRPSGTGRRTSSSTAPLTLTLTLTLIPDSGGELVGPGMPVRTPALAGTRCFEQIAQIERSAQCNLLAMQVEAVACGRAAADIGASRSRDLAVR